MSKNILIFKLLKNFFFNFSFCNWNTWVVWCMHMYNIKFMGVYVIILFGAYDIWNNLSRKTTHDLICKHFSVSHFFSIRIKNFSTLKTPVIDVQASIMNSMKLVILLHFISWKKKLQTMQWHHNATGNSHQRWKQTQNRVCFHLTFIVLVNSQQRWKQMLSSLVWIDSGVVVSQHRLESFFHEIECNGMMNFMEFMLMVR